MAASSRITYEIGRTTATQAAETCSGIRTEEADIDLRTCGRVLFIGGGADSVVAFEVEDAGEHVLLHVLGVFGSAEWSKVARKFGLDIGMVEDGVTYFIRGDGAPESAIEYLGLFDAVCALADPATLEVYSPADAAHELYIEWANTLNGFPRLWELFGYLLRRKTRVRIFQPAFHDLLADYFETRAKRFQTPVAKWWLNFCFTFRTIGLVIECFRVTFLGGLIATLLAMIPTGVKNALAEWIWSFIKRQ